MVPSMAMVAKFCSAVRQVKGTPSWFDKAAWRQNGEEEEGRKDFAISALSLPSLPPTPRALNHNVGSESNGIVKHALACTRLHVLPSWEAPSGT